MSNSFKKTWTKLAMSVAVAASPIAAGTVVSIATPTAASAQILLPGDSGNGGNVHTDPTTTPDTECHPGSTGCDGSVLIPPTTTPDPGTVNNGGNGTGTGIGIGVGIGQGGAGGSSTATGGAATATGGSATGGTLNVAPGAVQGGAGGAGGQGGAGGSATSTANGGTLNVASGAVQGGSVNGVTSTSQGGSVSGVVGGSSQGNTTIVDASQHQVRQAPNAYVTGVPCHIGINGSLAAGSAAGGAGVSIPLGSCFRARADEKNVNDLINSNDPAKIEIGMNRLAAGDRRWEAAINKDDTALRGRFGHVTVVAPSNPAPNVTVVFDRDGQPAASPVMVGGAFVPGTESAGRVPPVAPKPPGQ